MLNARTGDPADSPPALLAGVLGAGLLGGLALGLVTGAWGRTPAGNTALVVSFTGGPALLAAGWTVLALAFEHGVTQQDRLLAGGLLAGGLALLVALVAVFTPTVGITSAPGASPEIAVSLLAIAAPPLLALVLGLVLARWIGRIAGGRAWPASAGVALAAILLALLPTGLGFVVAPLSVPIVLVTPLLASPGSASRRRHLAAAAIGLVAVVVGGIVLGGRLPGNPVM